MAVIYCRSTDGNDADDGSTWALAKATLAAALTAAGAGGTVYVSQAHAETQASAMTLTSPGTTTSPTVVLCANDGAEPPTALATTGTVSTTGASNISIAGFLYCYGLTFNAGSAGNTANIQFTNASTAAFVMDGCKLVLNNTSTSSQINIGSTSSAVDSKAVLNNTICQFGATGQSIRVFAAMVFIWKNTASAIAGTVPTTLISMGSTNSGGRALLYGLDLSAAGSGKNIFGGTSSATALFIVRNCKLGASVTLVSGAIHSQSGIEVDLINCDSGDTNYTYHKARYQGDVTQETTIVRSGGATDGTTPFSRKMVSSGNTFFYFPLEAPACPFWCDTVGSVTVTIEVVTDNVTLKDDECWVEVDYPGTSGYPQSVTASDRKTDYLATAAAQSSSSVTWTTTGLTTPVKQKLSVTFTTTKKGPIFPRVMLAKASTTVYFDPMSLPSAGRNYMTEVGNVINEAPASAPAGGGANLLGNGTLTAG